MKRITQDLSELEASLSSVEADWKDDHINDVESLFPVIEAHDGTVESLVRQLFDTNFLAAKTLVRTFLYLSKDEFDLVLKDSIGGNGITKYKENPNAFISCLERLDVFDKVSSLTSRNYTWKDILLERLRSGRGSAIKGQKRGRGFEDQIEEVVVSVFGEGNYESRCRFVGVSGQSTEKTDFAIPNKEHPQVLVEAKAYGATGSKQTDIIGDVRRIIAEKRRDTYFILVTDGVTWKLRRSDLKKLVEIQHSGEIYRIYTQIMFPLLKDDLIQLKAELSL